MRLSSVLATPQFRIWCIPIIFVLVGAYAKRLGRRDGDNSPWWENWAVATSTLLMTVGTIVADIQRQTANSRELVAWLVGVLLFVFVSVEHERFRSWRLDGSGVAIRKPIVGVLIPDMVSVVIFVAYQASKVGP
jgi:membrane protein YdbS with pleckstrin-like domain